MNSANDGGLLDPDWTGSEPFAFSRPSCDPTWMPRRRSARAYPFTPPTPLQAPSLEVFDERIAAIITDVGSVEGLQPNTQAWARRSYRAFRRFLKETGAERAFLSGDVRAQATTLQRWIAWLRQSGLSRTALNSYWRGMASITRWIQRREATMDPFVYVATPGVGQLQPRCLTRSAAETFLSTAKNYPWLTRLERSRNLAIVGLMLLAGLRRGEVLRLGFADVDPVVGTISVLRGKGVHGGKDRTAYMPEQLRAILTAYIRERAAAGRTHPEFVSSLRGNVGISSSVLRNVFRTLCSASGVHASPHMLRHTYATLLRQSGVPDRVLMELLGHASLAMTYRYAHVYAEEVRANAERLRIDVRL